MLNVGDNVRIIENPTYRRSSLQHVGLVAKIVCVKYDKTIHDNIYILSDDKVGHLEFLEEWLEKI